MRRDLLRALLLGAPLLILSRVRARSRAPPVGIANLCF